MKKKDDHTVNEVVNPDMQAVLMPLSRVTGAVPGAVMAVTDAEGHALHYTIPEGAIAVRIQPHELTFIGADHEELDAAVITDPPVEDGQPLPR